MRLLTALFIVMLAAHVSAAENPEQNPEKLVEKLGNNRFRLGDIVIDKNTDSVRFPAKVNMNEGLLELLLCAPYGKTHESLFVTEVDAVYLNLALIMIGCEKGKVRVKHQGEDVIPDGTLLTIEVAYKDEDGNKEEVIRAEDWVYNKKAGRPMLHTNWVYTGSFIADGEYMAKLTGTYIVTFHDSFTIIDLPLEEGADDTVFWVNKNAAKKKGYPVELIITRIKAEKPVKIMPVKETAREGKTKEPGESEGPSEEKKIIVDITLLSEDRVKVEEKVYTHRELEAYLKNLIANKGEENVKAQLISKKEIKYSTVVEVLKACQRAGCTNTSMVMVPEEQKPVNEK